MVKEDEMSTQDNLVQFNSDDSTEYNSDRVDNNTASRPAGNPRSNKDFRKILSKKEEKKDTPLILKRTPLKTKLFQDPQMEQIEESIEDSVDELAMNDEGDKKNPVFSLFDLPKAQTGIPVTDMKAVTPVKVIADTPSEDKEGVGMNPNLAADHPSEVESPSALFSKITAKPNTKPFVVEQKPEKMPENTNYVGGATEETKPIQTLKKDNYTSNYSQDRPDFSYVNPMAIAQSAAGGAVSPTTPVITQIEQPAPVDSQLAEIARQLIDKMYTVQQAGQTDTVITLKNPPMFEGANLIVTSFDSARGEFNISFENLTQEAQKILDNQQNRYTLLTALEQRGYNVHIVTTTTLIESTPLADESKPGDEKSREGGGRDERDDSATA